MKARKPDALSERRLINGHDLALQTVEWRCLTCRRWFDAASDAEAVACTTPVAVNPNGGEQ